MKIRVGFGLGGRSGVDDQEGYRLLVDELERLRFDSLWVSERLSAPGPDPTVAMAIAAARTERLKFGPSVMVLPGRNPVVLAKELASLDRWSGGRLLPAFGLGAPQIPEHQAFGVRRQDRAPMFDEALELMRRLWAGGPVTHRGRFFSVDEVTIAPLPVQQPMDVWLGGVAPSELRRVGRIGDGWLPSFVTPADVAQGITTVQEMAAEHDREIDPEHFGVLIPYAEGELSDRTVEAVLRRRPGLDPGEVLAASVADLAPLIERFVEVGASKFVVMPFAPLGDVTAHLEELASVVRPLEN